MSNLPALFTVCPWANDESYFRTYETETADILTTADNYRANKEGE